MCILLKFTNIYNISSPFEVVTLNPLKMQHIFLATKINNIYQNLKYLFKTLTFTSVTFPLILCIPLEGLFWHSHFHVGLKSYVSLLGIYDQLGFTYSKFPHRLPLSRDFVSGRNSQSQPWWSKSIWGRSGCSHHTMLKTMKRKRIFSKNAPHFGT